MIDARQARRRRRQRRRRRKEEEVKEEEKRVQSVRDEDDDKTEIRASGRRDEKYWSPFFSPLSAIYNDARRKTDGG